MLEENMVIVSVVCMTYNQEKYIKDAIESFLMQKTNFKYEIIIHDDASSDNTALIIKKYEQEHPDVIKTICQQKNQYSQNVNILQEYLIPMTRGKYIAFCEGDDYWTDVYKLQKQVDALEKNVQCTVCAHAVSIVTSKEKKKIGEMAPSQETTIFPVEKVILEGGGFVGTNSLMLKKEIFKDIPQFRRIYPFDYSLQIWGALRGGMLYLADCMADYRAQADSSWSITMKNNPALKMKHYARIIEMLRSLDQYTQGKYKTEIRYSIQLQEYSILLLKGDYKKIIKGEYESIFREESVANRFKIYIRVIFPWSVRLNKWRRMYARKK